MVASATAPIPEAIRDLEVPSLQCAIEVSNSSEPSVVCDRSLAGKVRKRQSETTREDDGYQLGSKTTAEAEIRAVRARYGAEVERRIQDERPAIVIEKPIPCRVELAKPDKELSDWASQGFEAIMDSGSEVNVINMKWAKKKKFQLLHTDVGLRAVQGKPVVTYGMCVINFNAYDRYHRLRTFEETFLVGDIETRMILGMPWLALANPDINHAERKLTWRTYTVSCAMSTERRVELIDPEELAEIAVSRSLETFVMHPCVPCGPKLDDSNKNEQEGQCAAVEACEVSIPEAHAEFADVFSAEQAATLSEHGLQDHAIEIVEGKQPPHGPIYSCSSTELQAMKQYIDDNLRSGFIRPSSSPAGAPVLFVKKPNGGLRLCVDYRGLNAITIKNRYPLPLIGESLDRLSQATRFTQLDLINAYHRLRIRKGDEWKTAFRTRYGHYEYQVMPFGLTNAPATFQGYINSILAERLDITCIVYLDDILIYTKEDEDHHEAVHWVLAQLRKHSLYVNLKKCRFDAQEVNFLGFVVTPEGMKMEDDRVKSVEEWPKPQSKRDIQVFIGFANFYRRFIKNFSKIAYPLTELTKGDSTVRRTDFLIREGEVAFQTLKNAFCSAPILRHFDQDRPIRVETDASGYAIGAILAQQDNDQQWHPVAYFSRKMISAERNYETHDAELLAIVEAFKQWRHYLEGAIHQVTVLTDHHNLRKFMYTTKLSGRQIRWAHLLSRYDFSIVYREGPKNPADGLSRFPEKEPSDEARAEDTRILTVLQNSLNNDARCRLAQAQRCTLEQSILSAGTAATPGVVGFWADVRSLLAIEDAYAPRCRDGPVAQQGLQVGKDKHAERCAGGTAELQTDRLTARKRGLGHPQKHPAVPRNARSRSPEIVGIDHLESRSPAGGIDSLADHSGASLPVTSESRSPAGGIDSLADHSEASLPVTLESRSPAGGIDSLADHAGASLPVVPERRADTPFERVLKGLYHADALAQKEIAGLITQTIAVENDEVQSGAVRRRGSDARNKLTGLSGKPWALQDGILLHDERVYVPEPLREEIFVRYHDQKLGGGHLAKDKTQDLVASKYYWPVMKRDIAQWIEECPTCTRSKAPRHKPYGKLQSLPIPEYKWTDISMDFVNGLPLSKDWTGTEYDAILVIVDRLTKMAHYVPVKTTLTAEQLAEVLIDVLVRYHGLPDSIVSDRGSLFTSHYWSALCHFLSVKRRLSTAFHPETDGQTERQNSTMEQYLRAYCNFEQDDWVRLLPVAEFSYNNAKHATTSTSPFEANLGYRPRMSWDEEIDPRKRSKCAVEEAKHLTNLIRQCRENIAEAQLTQVRYYDRMHQERLYKLGKKVWLNGKYINTKRARKLEQKMFGPFSITKIVGKHAYELELPSRWRIHPVFHVSLLEKDSSKRGEYAKENDIELDPGEDEDHQEYIVDKIVDSVYFEGDATNDLPEGLHYNIHWKGFPVSEDTWEPFESVMHLKGMISQFHKNHPNRPSSTLRPKPAAKRTRLRLHQQGTPLTKKRRNNR